MGFMVATKAEGGLLRASRGTRFVLILIRVQLSLERFLQGVQPFLFCFSFTAKFLHPGGVLFPQQRLVAFLFVTIHDPSG